ncbi:MAG: SH3 domain-containing protein [Anaerolineae bacterium]|nr:SH3 domain-containing protein [Anaerolineae bacterium]
MIKTNLRFTSLLTILVALVLVAVAITAPNATYAQTAPLSLTWQGYYWNNNNFQGSPVLARTDFAVNFNWGAGSPGGSVPSDNFSARWYTTINVTTAGNFTFRAGADDGIRVAIDGNVYINRFYASSSFTLTTQDIYIGTGNHQIIVDYFEGTGNAGVLMEIIPNGGQVNNSTTPGQPTATPVPGTTPIPIGTPVPTGPVKAQVTAARANLRNGPGTQYAQIGDATKGQTFVVLAKDCDCGFETWFLVDLGGGAKAWIFRQLIYVFGGNIDAIPKSQEILPVPEGPSSSGAVTVTQVTGQAKFAVAVRDVPSTRSGQKIAVIERGQSFIVIKLSTNRAWVQVNYNGLIGWVYLPNVRIVSGKLGSLPRGNS